MQREFPRDLEKKGWLGSHAIFLKIKNVEANHVAAGVIGCWDVAQKSTRGPPSSGSKINMRSLNPFRWVVVVVAVIVRCGCGVTAFVPDPDRDGPIRLSSVRQDAGSANVVGRVLPRFALLSLESETFVLYRSGWRKR